MPLQISFLLLSIATVGGYAAVAIFTRLLFSPTQTKTIAGFPVQGLLPSLVPGFSGVLAGVVRQHFQSPELLEKTIDDPALLAQLRPELEKHIDLFLKDKLPLAFPLLANMMGEKTKATLKGAFMEEVQTIFPSVMKSFSGQLFDRLQPAQLIEKKLADIDWPAFQKIIRNKAGRQILILKLAGAGAGMLIGLLQLLAIYFLG